MSDLDEIVSVVIQVDSNGVEKQGFGLLCIMSHNATFPERIRYYSGQAAVLADWASDSPEALHSGAAFSQNPHPQQVAIGRCTTSLTLKYAMTPIVVAANHTYAVQMGGQGVTPTTVSYTTGTSKSLDLATKTTHMTTVIESTDNTVTPTIAFVADAGSKAGSITDVAHVVTVHFDPTVSQVSDVEALLATATSVRIRSAAAVASTVLTTPADVFSATALATATVTNDEITSNLVALMQAVVGKNYTATQAGATGSHTIQILGNAPGNWFFASVLDALSLKNAITNTGDPTADYVAINLAADPEFYVVDTLYNSPSVVEATAAWVEANGKTYSFDVPETDVLNTTSTGTSDTVDTVTSHGYTRVLGQYHPRQQEALSAALEGRVISLNPGLWTAAFKTLVGPTVIKITDTQRANLKAKRGGAYFKRAGRSVTLYGQVGSTVYNFLDTVVGLDFFTNDIQTSAFGVFAGADKVGYDDADIEQIAGAIRGAISRAMSDDHKIISRGTPGSLTDPIPTIVFPKVADIDPSARALRNLPDGVLTCRLLGAVQSVAMRAVITF